MVDSHVQNQYCLAMVLLHVEFESQLGILEPEPHNHHVTRTLEPEPYNQNPITRTLEPEPYNQDPKARTLEPEP